MIIAFFVICNKKKERKTKREGKKEGRNNEIKKGISLRELWPLKLLLDWMLVVINVIVMFFLNCKHEKETSLKEFRLFQTSTCDVIINAIIISSRSTTYKRDPKEKLGKI